MESTTLLYTVVTFIVLYTQNIWCSGFTDQQLQYHPAPDGAQAAVFLHGVELWKKPEVTVAFTNTTVDLLHKWNLKEDTIFKWANKWSTLQEQQPNQVPKFVDHFIVNRSRSVVGSDIIVELNGNNNIIIIHFNQ
jgi:hypothetical protein